MNRFFKDIATIDRMKNGPLGCHISAYAEKLHAQGFSWQSGKRKLQLAADFSRWLKRNGVLARQVRTKHVGKYLQFRRRSGFGVQLGDPPAVTGFLKFLRDQGVTKEPLPKPIIIPYQRWLSEYDGYLQKERALSPATRINYAAFVRRFLAS